MKKSGLAVALLVGALCGTASAAPQVCDLSAGTGAYRQSSLTISCEGAPLTVDVRSGLYAGGGVSDPSNFDESSTGLTVSRYSGNGLGVFSSKYEQHTIDNFRGDEYVRFVFSSPVRVLSVVLVRIGEDLVGADADVSFLSGALGGTWTSLAVSGLAESSSYTYALPLLAASHQFRFGPRFDDDDDDFKIRSITVDAHVPLPGTLALLGLGLLGAGLLRRRG